MRVRIKMETQTEYMNDERKNEIVNLFLVSLGEAICTLMNDADFQRIRFLKNGIDSMFNECDRAIQQSKIHTVNNYN